MSLSNHSEPSETSDLAVVANFMRTQGKMIQVSAGTTIFRQDQQIDFVWLIESGMVKITGVDIRGNETVFELRGPGRLLGAAALLHQRLTLMSAVTLMPTEFYQIQATLFLQKLKGHSETTLALAQLLSQQYHNLVERYIQNSQMSARQRVACLFLDCIPANKRHLKKDIRLELPARHIDLARLLLITPEHFSRTLAEMKKDEIIYERGGWVIVSDIERLMMEVSQKSKNETYEKRLDMDQ